MDSADAPMSEAVYNPTSPLLPFLSNNSSPDFIHFKVPSVSISTWIQQKKRP